MTERLKPFNLDEALRSPDKIRATFNTTSRAAHVAALGPSSIAIDWGPWANVYSEAEQKNCLRLVDHRKPLYVRLWKNTYDGNVYAYTNDQCDLEKQAVSWIGPKFEVQRPE